jgi:formylglycine-generating enzyme required for sulfatase activity
MSLAVDIDQMVRIPGGEFLMGSDGHYPEEAPAHVRHVAPFLLDVHPVTNAEFARFVRATEYVTDAERGPQAHEYPGLPEHLLVPGSAVFVRPETGDRPPEGSWWHFRPGACWYRPEGEGSGLDGREHHPVVHVSHRDASAYAAWAGKRLPSEAEWERAARGGVDGRPFAWGDELAPGGALLANYWAGSFPLAPAEGAACGTTPVGSYAANAFGLRDVIGNVWEWTTDTFHPGHQPTGCCGSAAAADPLQVGGVLRVLKGGSFLCAADACARYRPAARIPQAEDSGASNVGFRCAA